MGNWTGWRGVLRINEDPQHIGFWCPGCETLHVYDERWKFDGNYDVPTFTPSLRTSTGHYVQGTPRMPDGRCGTCVRAQERGVKTICRMCHLFVTKGLIHFCRDSTHPMAGMTNVPMTVRDDP
jgi:hypothetical protein